MKAPLRHRPSAPPARTARRRRRCRGRHRRAGRITAADPSRSRPARRRRCRSGVRAGRFRGIAGADPVAATPVPDDAAAPPVPNQPADLQQPTPVGRRRPCIVDQRPGDSGSDDSGRRASSAVASAARRCGRPRRRRRVRHPRAGSARRGTACHPSHAAPPGQGGVPGRFVRDGRRRHGRVRTGPGCSPRLRRAVPQRDRGAVARPARPSDLAAAGGVGRRPRFRSCSARDLRRLGRSGRGSGRRRPRRPRRSTSASSRMPTTSPRRVSND